jgi:phosphoglycolate phosphatase
VNLAQPEHGGWRAAIIDLDGTLVDTLGDFEVSLGCMLRDLGLPPIDRETIERLIGKGSQHLIRNVLAHVHAAPSLYEQALMTYQKHYCEINGAHSTVYPGAAEGLLALKRRGLKLACLTNKYTRFAKALLETKRLHRFFDGVFGGDLFERIKPDPLPLQQTCQALVAPPSRTLVIGDSSNDARAARAAGCPVILVTYGYNHGQAIRAVDADGFADSLADAAAMLRPPACPAGPL